MFHLQQHEQLYQILKAINELPNTPVEESKEYVLEEENRPGEYLYRFRKEDVCRPIRI